MRRLRDGTRSCVECRRRKNRCVFEPGVQTCVSCSFRGTLCIAQGLATQRATSGHDEKDLLAWQVDQLLQTLEARTELPVEAATKARALTALKTLKFGIALGTPFMVETASMDRTKKPELLTTPMDSPKIEHTPRSYDLPTPNRNAITVPIMTLFDNVVIQQDRYNELGVGDFEHDDSIGQRERRVLHCLRSVCPSLEDLRSIFRAATIGWPFWIRSFSPVLEDPSTPLDDESFLLFIHRLLQSKEPSTQIKGTICLVVSIEQLPHTFNFSHRNLTACLAMIQEQCLVALDMLLCCDTFVSTLDGMECIAVMAQFYTDRGEPNKAWLMLRRAAGFAFMARFHRLSATSDDSQFERKKVVWVKIWQIDRFLSLILGHPYGISDEFIYGEHFPTSSPVEKLFEGCAIITGRIIKMNQCPGLRTFSTTIKLDEELEGLSASMPPTFWSTSYPLSLSIDAATQHYRNQISYYTIRKMLHLPFMLASFTDLRYRYSRIAAVESSRACIQTFREGHQLQQSGAVCNVLNFEAFTSAVALVLHLFESPLGRESLQWMRDWELIRNLKMDLESISQKMSCNVAGQAAKILDFFHSARYQWPDSADGNGAAKVDLVIPYFGRVQIRKGESLTGRNLRRSLDFRSIHEEQLWSHPSEYSIAVSHVPVPESDADIVGHEFEFGTEQTICFESFFQPVLDDNVCWPDLLDNWTTIGIPG